MIRLALNQKSCKHLNILDFIKFSKNFIGVELNFKKIKKAISKGIKLKDILETLEIFDLKVISIFCLKDFSLCSDKDYKTKILNNLMLMLDYCYKLESNLIITNPSFLKFSSEPYEIPKWRIVNRTIKRLKDISKKAIEGDINIGFEFLNLPDSSISTLNEAKEVLKPLQSLENIGYIIDSFHLAKSKTNFNELNDIKDFIFLIQLSDLKYNLNNQVDELNALNDSERIFPGEGNFDFKSFLKTIEKIRYNKPYSIELSKNDCSENFYKKFFRIFKND